MSTNSSHSLELSLSDFYSQLDQIRSLFPHYFTVERKILPFPLNHSPPIIYLKSSRIPWLNSSSFIQENNVINNSEENNFIEFSSSMEFDSNDENSLINNSSNNNIIPSSSSTNLSSFSSSSSSSFLYYSQYEIHYSSIYKVPQLYFSITEFDGTPIEEENVLNYLKLKSTMKSSIIQESNSNENNNNNISSSNSSSEFGGFFSRFLSMEFHPISGRPILSVHPCKTGEFMGKIQFNEKKLNVLSWLSLISPHVGLELPWTPQLKEFLMEINQKNNPIQNENVNVNEN